MPDVAVDGNRSGVAEVVLGNAATENRDAVETGSPGGFDVPHRVTDEQRVLCVEAGLVERGLHDVGVGLRLLDIVLARDVVDHVVGVERSTQTLRLLRRRTRRQHDDQARLLRRSKQVGSTVERRQLVQERPVEVRVRVSDVVVRMAEHGLDEAVSTLPDRLVQLAHRDVMPVRAQRT